MMMFSSASNVARLRRINDDLAAAQTFAEIIVGVAFELERHAARHERAKALARAAVELELDRVFGQAVRPVRFVISLPVIVPTTRFTLRMGNSARTFSPRSMAGSQCPAAA